MTNIRYFISAREWFDKTYGNTYHSVRVWDTVTGESAVVPFAYGHGHGTLVAAAERALGVVIERGTYVLDCADVARKRDLHRA